MGLDGAGIFRVNTLYHLFDQNQCEEGGVLERPPHLRSFNGTTCILNDLFSGHHDLVPYREQTRE